MYNIQTNTYRWLLLFLAIASILPLSAQDYYTVFVGSFVEARPANFDNIRSQGFLHTQMGEGGLEQVYLGRYSDQQSAASTAQGLRNSGFTNAQAVPGSYGTGTEVAVIQIASRYQMDNINWAEMAQIGPLNVLVNDNIIKIVSGTFPDAASAQSELAGVRALGFSDAFVKMVNSSLLLPVEPIATGLKNDLIPLSIENTPPTTTPAAPTPSTTTSSPSVPVVPRGGAPTAVINNSGGVVNTGPLANRDLPRIRGDVKRSSVVDLQRALQARGYYTSTLDGYYGSGTETAYLQVLNDDFTLEKYRRLFGLYLSPALAPVSGFRNWEEVQLLETIAYDLNPLVRTEIEAQKESLADQAQLYSTPPALTPAEINYLENWHQTIWRNIGTWTTNDPHHQDMAAALQLTYYQSRVRLEDFYLDQGYTLNDAEYLALAALQSIAGLPLERFE